MANTSGSKIEASNADFNTLMSAIYTFLNTSASQVGLGNSGVDKYSFPSGNTFPHTITSTQTSTANSFITNNYTSALNVIYDIWKNNYMKNNSITIPNAHQEYKNTNSIIPALKQYQDLVNYWNTGSSACNGACTGYCEGNCAGAAQKISNNTTGSWSNGTCNSCTSGCINDCGVGCQQACNTSCSPSCTLLCSICRDTCDKHCDTDCSTICGSACANKCSDGCYTSCSGTASDGCSDACTGGCNSCQGGCSGCRGGCTGSCTGGERPN